MPWLPCFHCVGHAITYSALRSGGATGRLFVFRVFRVFRVFHVFHVLRLSSGVSRRRPRRAPGRPGFMQAAFGWLSGMGGIYPHPCETCETNGNEHLRTFANRMGVFPLHPVTPCYTQGVTGGIGLFMGFSGCDTPVCYTVTPFCRKKYFFVWWGDARKGVTGRLPLPAIPWGPRGLGCYTLGVTGCNRFGQGCNGIRGRIPLPPLQIPLPPLRGSRGGFFPVFALPGTVPAPGHGKAPAVPWWDGRGLRGVGPSAYLSAVSVPCPACVSAVASQVRSTLSLMMVCASVATTVHGRPAAVSSRILCRLSSPWGPWAR